jgi:hypothetical protein
MQFYSYVTENPKAFGLTDDPLGTMGKSIDRDLKTVNGVVRRLRRAWPGRSFKVFTFTNFYDERTYRLVHLEVA